MYVVEGTCKKILGTTVGNSQIEIFNYIILKVNNTVVIKEYIIYPWNLKNQDVNSNCARIFTDKTKFVFFIMAIFTSAVVMSLALSMVWIPVRKDGEPSGNKITMYPAQRLR